ncbi:hypothetical protein [Cupriavidus gilardii]|uniref:hypothetical protein n=1 Tax=Cupriavidus gilardii TaxID=82541 RepID=UPI003CC7CB38
MAAGVNYNGVWAARGKPVSVFNLHGSDLHIAGSDASGIVWEVGEALEDGSREMTWSCTAIRSTMTIRKRMAVIRCCRLARGSGAMRRLEASL